jgi:RNA polymerase sigma-54 factor
MYFEMGMGMSQEMGMRVTPALLNLAHLLTLPALNLSQVVQQELAENPALEEIEHTGSTCARCGSPMIDAICLRCIAGGTTGEPLPAAAGDDTTDPLLFVSAPRDLTETLLSDLRVSLPEADHPLALAVVGNLDERGLLAEDPADLAADCNVPVERIEAVIQRLREIGPPGIAARDSRECMCLQLDTLEAQGLPCAHVRAILLEHLDDLAAGRLRQIARTLRISVAEVEEARRFIRQHLWPYPAHAAYGGMAPPNRVRYRTPDLAIRNQDDAFVVDVLHSPRRVLRLNPLYQELARRSANLDEAERAHVQEYINRARVFLANLRQRESTLERIGKAIVSRQEDFLHHGVRHLQPMTRAEIAVELELHESTVSRTVAEKTALLPDQSLLPLSEFFVAARGVQDVLRELIANEQAPLSDDALAGLLAERGYTIARRTVAKYRTQMRIPPAHLRA